MAPYVDRSSHPPQNYYLLKYWIQPKAFTRIRHCSTKSGSEINMELDGAQNIDQFNDDRILRLVAPHVVRITCAGSARGSRGAHLPASTCAMNSATWRLNSSGSSRLSVWPVFGNTASPDREIVRLRNRPGCRQWSSSSPTITSTGVCMARNSASRS